MYYKDYLIERKAPGVDPAGRRRGRYDIVDPEGHTFDFVEYTVGNSFARVYAIEQAKLRIDRNLASKRTT